MVMKRSSVLAFAAIVVVGLLAMPAVAAEEPASDDYPLDTDGEVLDRDVTVDAEVEDVAVVEPEAEVLGRVLALTGTQLVPLLVAGSLLIGFGWFGLTVGRRRRPVAPE